VKTVSTKLDNKLHDQFVTLCNEDGKCQSEFLRDLIETLCEDCSENGKTSSKDLEEEEPVTQGIVKRVSYDSGKTWHDVKPIPELRNPTIEY